MEPGAPEFLNQVIKIECALSPEQLMDALETVEARSGRESKGDHASRTLDLDLLLYGAREIQTDRLTIPHAGLLERPFVLIPLLDIDADLHHPVTGERLTEYLSSNAHEKVELYRDHTCSQV